jgi:hypothetical protein
MIICGKIFVRILSLERVTILVVNVNSKFKNPLGHVLGLLEKIADLQMVGRTGNGNEARLVRKECGECREFHRNPINKKRAF